MQTWPFMKVCMNTSVKEIILALRILIYLYIGMLLQGGELFPTKDSVLACLKDKIQTLERQRDAHMRLAQIVLRVEEKQVKENVVADEVQVVILPRDHPRR